MTDITKFITDQLSVWPLAAANFRALKSVREREFSVCGMPVKLQCNPARIQSSAADTSPEAIASRPCFLCLDTRPAEQTHLPFEGRKGRKYHIQVNPYPIFPSHLVIASDRHVPQSIARRYVDMLDMARELTGFTVFYNGPKSGASAPDHMHFQACPSDMMPLETAVRRSISEGDDRLRYLTSVQEARLFHFTGYARGVFVLRATTAKSMAKLFYRLTDSMPTASGEYEPRLNVLCWYASGEYRTVVIFRTNWRSRYWDVSGDDHLTISAGCADVAGLFVMPIPFEFEHVSAPQIADVLEDVTLTADMENELVWRLTRGQEKIEVGIMSASEINFEIISDGAGPQTVRFRDGRIDYNGALYDELFFDAVTPSSLFAEPTFVLKDVTIGIDFHWERKLEQKFAGALKFIVQGDKITAVNIVGIEDYLLSVISSEMKGSASTEFLKAHAVISRSWVMSQILKRREGKGCHSSEESVSGDDLFVKWFDHDDHTDFDVCADDHCQRYQGLGGTVSEHARMAVDETWGEVLTYDGQICDARFSKCCGGVMERFSTCWEDRDYPYLVSKPDRTETSERDFCDTGDLKVLSQVLNDYDLETKDFYRWTVSYKRSELSELVRRRSGIDFGMIRELIPEERGESGRIKLLKICGDKRSMTIGKELLIRRWLSESHLKSSNFEVEQQGDEIILHGRGWGHGVGLCQIGAAVMASEGYSYKDILKHYYPGSTLDRK